MGLRTILLPQSGHTSGNNTSEVTCGPFQSQYTHVLDGGFGWYRHVGFLVFVVQAAW